MFIERRHHIQCTLGPITNFTPCDGQIMENCVFNLSFYLNHIYHLCKYRANPANYRCTYIPIYLASELLAMSLPPQCHCFYLSVLLPLLMHVGIYVQMMWQHHSQHNFTIFRRNGKGIAIHHRVGDIKIYRESFAGNSIETSSTISPIFCVELFK